MHVVVKIIIILLHELKIILGKLDFFFKVYNLIN